MSQLVSSQDKTPADYKLILKTSPLNLFDPWNGSLLNLGAEVKLYSNIASYSQLGLYIPGIYILGDLTQNKGFQVKEEIKLYLNKKGLTKGDYISLELSYSNQSYNRTDTIDLTRIAGLKYAKKYYSERSFEGIVFQYGSQFTKLKWLVIDIYGGLGIRFNHINCSLTQEEAENRQLGDWDNPENNAQKIGNTIIPRLNFGIKLGYKLR